MYCRSATLYIMLCTSRCKYWSDLCHTVRSWLQFRRQRQHAMWVSVVC